MKIIIQIILTQIILFAGQYSNAQDLHGHIVQANGEAIPFATVSLHLTEDSSLVTGTSTDMDGYFVLSIPVKGSYYLKASSIGYEATMTGTFTIEETGFSKDLGSLVLYENVELLDEIVVKAMQASIVNKGDRLEMNVENTLLASEQNAYEVVKEAPGVIEDTDGELKMNGKSGVKVTINGRDSYVKGDELRSLLESMPAQNIKKMEVVNNPSAKYDAEGTAGVINIVLKRNAKMGFNGTVYSSYERNQLNEYSVGANLNYMNGRWNSFANVNFDRGGRFREMFLSREFHHNGNVTHFSQEGEDVRQYYLPSLQIGTDFLISKNQSLGIVADLSYNQSDQYWNTLGVLTDNDPKTDVIIDANNDFNNISKNQKYNLHYSVDLDTSGSTLKANVDYVLLKNETESSFFNDFTYMESHEVESVNYLASNPNSYEILATTLDYSKPLLAWKGQWESGIKASKVISDNRLDFFKLIDDEKVPFNARNNYFKYKENILAAYTNLSSQLSDQWHLQMGLRGEYTFGNGFSKSADQEISKGYFNLFPSIQMNQSVSDQYQISYSYSRRINRPKYKHLNPSLFYIDPYTSVQGNPGMQPQYTHAFQVAQTYKRKYNLILGYDASTAYMGEVPAINAAENTTVLAIRNMEEFRNASATFIAPVQIGNYWIINNMVSSAYQYFKVNIDGDAIENKQFFFTARSGSRIKLPGDFIAEVNIDYRGPLAHGVYKINGQWGMDAGVQRSFFSDKLHLSLNVKDIFRSRRITGNLGIKENKGHIDQYLSNQSIQLGIRYNFSNGEQFKQSQRKINFEELNRAGG